MAPIGQPSWCQPSWRSPVGPGMTRAGEEQSLNPEGKQGRGRQGRQDCHKTEPQDYRALRCGVLAGAGQQEQRKSTYPGGDPVLNVTTGTDQATRLYGTARRPAFRRTSSSGPSKNSVQAATAGLPNECRHTSKQSTPPAFPMTRFQATWKPCPCHSPSGAQPPSPRERW